MTIIEPDIREETTIRTDDEQGQDRYTHIVVKPKGAPISAQAMVTQAIVMGQALLAYCGKVWVPSRNEADYPVCPTCIEEWERIAGKPFPGRR